MKLKVNGEEQQFSELKNVTDLVSHFKLENKLVVVEIDGEVIDRNEWQHTRLQEGMSIELVHFVGGG
ncbi:sulfur carrier protein ThiS [Pueribacillus sp. YX66]|uniref:sulfur carrier protein ThiS n=1 Tax=Pueribacillus sp. YX66 TaxID=3229242 RepID=UPI00358D5442